MKRFTIAFIFLMSFATLAFAGWTDVVKDYTINGLIAVLFAIVAAVFGQKWLALKKPIQALLDVFAEYRAGKLVQSEGGKDLTKDEWNKIFAKMTVAVEAIVAAMPESWLPKRG
jgi:hypothetical protein